MPPFTGMQPALTSCCQTTHSPSELGRPCCSGKPAWWTAGRCTGTACVHDTASCGTGVAGQPRIHSCSPPSAFDRVMLAWQVHGCARSVGLCPTSSGRGPWPPQSHAVPAARRGLVRRALQRTHVPDLRTSGSLQAPKHPPPYRRLQPEPSPVPRHPLEPGVLCCNLLTPATCLSHLFGSWQLSLQEPAPAMPKYRPCRQSVV